MEKVKSNKTILYIFVAVALLLSVIIANGNFTYHAKAAEVPQQIFAEGNASDYDFKITPTASIDMETLDDSDNNTVGLIFNSSMLTSKYVESDMEIEAYLVDKSREINLANCAVGLTPYKSTRNGRRQNGFSRRVLYLAGELFYRISLHMGIKIIRR